MLVGLYVRVVGELHRVLVRSIAESELSVIGNLGERDGFGDFGGKDCFSIWSVVCDEAVGMSEALFFCCGHVFRIHSCSLCLKSRRCVVLKGQIWRSELIE